MGTFRTLEEARGYFKGDSFATSNGMSLDELTDDYSVCSMTLGANHKNAYGGVMGGVIFTLADFAFATLSNNIHSPTVAQQVSISFLSAPKSERLVARAVCKKSGKNSSVINVDVTDSTGRAVAQFVGTGFKLSK